MVSVACHQPAAPARDSPALALRAGVLSESTAPGNFSMKGRTAASLLRQVASWHRALAKVQQPPAEWPRSNIEGLEFAEGSARGGNLKI
jgi:hypothetical protein